MNSLIQKIKALFRDGFFHILIGNVLIKLVAFLSSIVVVRLVSKQEYAYLGCADNYYQYINLLSGLGLSTALLKFCSPQRNLGENKFYFNLSIRVGVIFQLAASIVLVIGVYCNDIPFPQARGLVAVLILYPVFTLVITTLQNYIRSQLENKLFARMGVIQTIALFAASIPLALLLGTYGVVAARYIAMLVVIYIGYSYMRKAIPGNTQIVKPQTEEIKLFWKLAISMMLANLFSMIMPINETFLINSYIKDEIVSANYKVAVLIPSQIVFITNSIVVYLFPKIAQMANDLSGAFKKTIKVEGLLLGIIGFVCLVGYFVSPLLIRIVYGVQYLDAISLSKTYWIVYGINAGFRMLPMNVLPAVGSTSFNSTVSVVSCVVHAVVLRFLLERVGIYGAPYSLILVYSLSGILYWLYLFMKCYLKKNTHLKKKEG